MKYEELLFARKSCWLLFWAGSSGIGGWADYGMI